MVAASTRAMTPSRVPGAAAMSSLCSILTGRHASVGEAREQLNTCDGAGAGTGGFGDLVTAEG